MDIVFTRDPDAAVAVRQCADQVAEARLPPRLILAVCGGKHPPGEVLDALHQSFGPVPVYGGAAVGAITRAGLGYSGFELALGVFGPDDPLPAAFSTHALMDGEHGAGIELGRQVAAAAADNAVVMLLYDSVAANTPLRLHPGAPLVQGLYEGLGGKPVHLIGAGMLTDMNMTDGWIFDGNGTVKHCATALVFPPDVHARTVIMHGCRPVSSFMEITRIEGAEVFELDGRPALQVLEEMLNMSLGADDERNLTLIATLGQKDGDPFAPFDEKSYVNRLILGANRENGSITIFEPDFSVGSQVQIMARDNALMLESVEHGVEEIVRDVADKDHLMSFYIDCAGRSRAISGAAVEEADVAMNASAALGPVLGFYSGVEIAPFNNRSFPLDWTAVFSTLYRER